MGQLAASLSASIDGQVIAPADEAFAPTVYKNCDAVRGAGAAALYAGKPGYSFKRDRDRDRDACE
ncbi:hypothetical protein GS439_18100 [Rhodococcus hoagii]|nr:hypothetical protein [Prescottella equi]